MVEGFEYCFFHPKLSLFPKAPLFFKDQPSDLEANMKSYHIYFFFSWNHWARANKRRLKVPLKKFMYDNFLYLPLALKVDPWKKSRALGKRESLGWKKRLSPLPSPDGQGSYLIKLSYLCIQGILKKCGVSMLICRHLIAFWLIFPKKR